MPDENRFVPQQDVEGDVQIVAGSTSCDKNQTAAGILVKSMDSNFKNHLQTSAFVTLIGAVTIGSAHSLGTHG